MHLILHLFEGVSTSNLIRGLKDESDCVSLILSLDSDDVIIGCAAKDLGHGGQVHTQGELKIVKFNIQLF